MFHGGRTRMSVAVVLLGIGLVAAGCGDSGGSDGGGGEGPQITLRDFAIEISETGFQPGSVTFEARNEGPSVHEFEVFSGGTGEGLEVSSGVADTESLVLIDELEEIAPGTSGSLTLDLQPGTYAVICNLPAHYEQGMHASFTVE